MNVRYHVVPPGGPPLKMANKTQAEAIHDAIVILKMAQDRSDDVDAAIDWVGRATESSRAACWAAMQAQGWRIVERRP